MKKISINGALLVIAALLIFSAEGVLARLGLTAAAGLFGYLFMEQMVRSREEEKEEMLLRMEEMYREQQAELADLLDGITEQIVEGEEKRDESLGKLYRENEEMAKRLMDHGDKMESGLIQAAKELADQVIQAMEQQTEKNGVMTEGISQALLQLAGKGEEIGSLLEREERCCVSVEEQVRTVKTISEITAKKMQSLAEDHYNRMSDLFDDQNDNLSDSLESLKKDQIKLLREQGEKLNESVRELNQVVASGVGPVLDQNRELLKYVQEVQKQWTSLDEKELDFLNRVWEDR